MAAYSCTHRLAMGKEQIDNWGYFKNKIQKCLLSSPLRKCLLSSPLRFIRLLSKSVNLIERQKGSILVKMLNQRTNGPVNAHLISWPTLVKHKTYKT